jgi:hypothetical protein
VKDYLALTAAGTPGKAAHDAWCANDDWHLLDEEARAMWEDVARAGHERTVATGGPE